MDTMSSEILVDERYTVPIESGGADGMRWLRAHVVRFCDGPSHERRRTLVEQVVADLGLPPFVDTPTTSVLLALGFDPDLVSALADDVERVAAAYQPHAAQSGEADAAADRLVEACGGRTELAAARVCALVQGHAAMLALAAIRRAEQDGREVDQPAPVPSTRRVTPEGHQVTVDLADAHFGRGPHRCPGEALARHLAEAAAAR